MTDREFLTFCAEREDLRVESNGNREIELLPGTGPDTGDRNAEIAYQLRAWTKRVRTGRSFDSSTLFILPNGARRSPDASWIDGNRIARLPETDRGHLWHICPDFAIELRSPSDRLPLLESKMEEWMANGVALGWLIDPDKRSVAIYRADREPELIASPVTIADEGPLLGFVLDLAEIWEPS